MSELHLSEEDFAAKIEEGKETALVDFYADWCAPCRMLAPVIVELAKEYAGRAGVYKVDVDSAPGVAQRYGVRSIPTVILFKDGKEQNRSMGAQPREALASQLDALL